MIKTFIIHFLKYLLVFLVAFQNIATAQVQNTNGKQKIGRDINEEIIYDVKTGNIYTKDATGKKTPAVLPFDVPFIIKGEVPKNIIKVGLSIIEEDYAIKCVSCLDSCVSCKEYECNKKKAKKEEQKRINRENKKSREQERRKEKGKEDRKKKKRQRIKLNDDEEKFGCPDCKKPDFRYCQKLCPWKLSYLNRSDDTNTNTFSIVVPALKANTTYNLSFSFLKSVESERDTIISRFVPIVSKRIQNAYVYFEDDSLAGQTIDEFRVLDLQKYLKKNVDQYIIATYYIPSSVSKLLSPANSSSFRDLVNGIGDDGNTFLTLLSQKRISEERYHDTSDESLIHWISTINSGAFLGVYNGVAKKDSKTKDDVELLKLLEKIRKPSSVLSKISRGEISIENPEHGGQELQYIKSSDTLESFLNNITILKKELLELNSYLFGLKLNNDNRRQVYFNKQQLQEYNRLVVLKKLSQKEQNSYQRLTTLDDQNLGDISDLIEDIDIIISYAESTRRKIKDFQSYISSIEQLSEAFSNELLDNSEIKANSNKTTTADFVTRTSYYVSLDVGMAHIFYENQFANEIQPYYGLNFHLGPVNKQKKYYVINTCGKKLNFDFKSFYKNTSVIIGMTLNSLDEGGARKNSLKNMSLLTGLGVRISDPVRLSGGLVWNNVQSSNPFDSRTALRAYPYMALSFDLDVKQYLGDIGKKIFKL